MSTIAHLSRDESTELVRLLVPTQKAVRRNRLDLFDLFIATLGLVPYGLLLALEKGIGGVVARVFPDRGAG